MVFILAMNAIKFIIYGRCNTSCAQSIFFLFSLIPDRFYIFIFFAVEGTDSTIERTESCPLVCPTVCVGEGLGSKDGGEGGGFLRPPHLDSGVGGPQFLPSLFVFFWEAGQWSVSR